jgi:hypothetical protein
MDPLWKHTKWETLGSRSTLSIERSAISRKPAWPSDASGFAPASPRHRRSIQATGTFASTQGRIP